MSVIRVVPNTNGNYFVADNGTVFSRPRQGNKGGELKQRPHNHSGGYMCVDLRIGGKKTRVFVHRLVAQAFLDNPENKHCVNHKDGDKSNNSVENLEWCTHSENMKHAISLGLNAVPGLSGENHPMHKLTVEKVRRIRELHNGGVPCPTIARNFQITKEQVYNIVKRKHWKNV